MFIFFVAVLAALFAFDSVVPESTGKSYERTYYNGSTSASSTDTLTNTEADTLTIPDYLLSDWEYNITLRATAATGTRSVITILEESNERSGTTSAYWYEVERDTAKSGTATLHLQGDHYSVKAADVGKVRGVRQRVRLVGTGTQKTNYTLKFTYKRD